MQLKIDVWHHLLDVYTKFQITKHVKKNGPENFKKSKMRKTNRENCKSIIFAKNGTFIEKYIAGHLCNQFEVIILIYEAMIRKNMFDLLLAVN